MGHSAVKPRPRILFLNRSYWPDSEATGQLLTALCEGLADDFEVHVLAGQPNAVAESNWKDTVLRNGVTIHRAAHTTFSKRYMALKAINFVSFVMAADHSIRRIPRPDVVVFETDPFLLPYVARRLGNTTACKTIGYLQDIYPDVAVALGKIRNSWAIQGLRSSLFSIYQKCSRMVVLSRDMQQLLIDSGVAADCVQVIPNWADTQLIQPVEGNNLFLERHQLHNRFVVMYSGNMGLTQRLEDFVEAAALLQDDDQIQFVFVGQGATRPDLEMLVRSRQLTNVMFLDYQPLTELSHSLSAADLHLVPLNKALAQCLMPSKLYGILAAGRPYLTNAPAGTELHELTVQNQVGLVVSAGSPAAIADSVRGARANIKELRKMGVNGRRLAESRYSQASAITAFREMLQDVLSNGK